MRNIVAFQAARKQEVSSGFTIVELLIVIVVIAILAAITIVAFNGIQGRATETSLQADLRNAKSKLLIGLERDGALQTTTDSLPKSGNTTLTLSVNNSGATKTFCLTATLNSKSFFVTESSNPTQGVCPVNNVVTWTPVSGAGNWFEAAISNDGQKILATEYSGYVRVSTNGGSTWSTQMAAGNAGRWNDVVISGDGVRMFALAGSILSKSTTTGSSWTQIPFPNGETTMNFMDASDDGTYIVIANQTNAYLSSNGGTSWTLLPNRPTSNNITDVVISDDGQHIYLTVSGVCRLFHTANNGASWTERAGTAGCDIATTSNGAGIQSITGSSFKSSTDYGATGVTRALPSSVSGKNLQTSSDGAVSIFSPFSSGSIYTTVDSGQTWQEATSLGSQAWNAVQVSQDGSYFIAVRYSTPIQVGSRP